MTKYFIYCRKSSEEEERQALSIDAQLRELREYANKHGLVIEREFIESKSAKKPGREVFGEMLDVISTRAEVGDSIGILAWQPDRLSRNSVDGGTIIHLIDEGLIQDLKFPSYFFENTPHGKFNLSIAFGFSKMYVDRLSEDVKRGIREKVRRGEFPGKAPLGYINDLRSRKILPDIERFDLIQSLLESFSKGEMSQAELRKELFNQGIKTKSGKLLNYNTLANILKNPFYYGCFKLNNELHQGTHTPMISKETYDQIQNVLKRQARKVDWTLETRNEKNFLFGSFALCGECDYAITHETHKKKGGGHHKYYRCSHKSKTIRCSQRSYLREAELAHQVSQFVSSIAMPNEIYPQALHWIENWQKEETAESETKLLDLRNQRNELKLKLERLLDLQLEGDICQEEYKSKKNKLIEQKSAIEGQINKITSKGVIWLESMQDLIQTCHQAQNSLQKQDFITMKKILKKIGSNHQILDKKLNIQFERTFNFIRERSLYPTRQTGSSSSSDKLQDQKNLQSQTTSASVILKNKPPAFNFSTRGAFADPFTDQVPGANEVSGGLVSEWYPRGNSNPCCSDENRMS